MPALTLVIGRNTPLAPQPVTQAYLVAGPHTARMQNSPSPLERLFSPPEEGEETQRPIVIPRRKVRVKRYPETSPPPFEIGTALSPTNAIHRASAGALGEEEKVACPAPEALIPRATPKKKGTRNRVSASLTRLERSRDVSPFKSSFSP